MWLAINKVYASRPALITEERLHDPQKAISSNFLRAPKMRFIYVSVYAFTLELEQIEFFLLAALSEGVEFFLNGN